MSAEWNWDEAETICIQSDLKRFRRESGREPTADELSELVRLARGRVMSIYNNAVEMGMFENE